MDLMTTNPPQMTLRITRGKSVKEQPIATLNEASAIWDAYRQAKNVRSSTMPAVDIIVCGEARAHVSYNGKVWAGRPQDWKSGTLPLFDPYADQPAL